MSRPIAGLTHRFDALTSLLNQAAYKEDIRDVAKGTLVLTAPVCCIRMDVDDFKIVNNTFGHAAGDDALRHIASVLTKLSRERDRIYRISGDEFGLLCTNYTEDEAVGAMRRVCATLAKNPVRWVNRKGEPSEFLVSVSIGVAETDDPRTVEAAYQRADDAAYLSKDAGKARVTKASALKSY